MVSFWQNTLFIALILAISVPCSSTSDIEKWRRFKDSNGVEQYLRDLCSKTEKSDVCWKLMKPELHRFDNSGNGEIIDSVIDLARERSKGIHDQLDKWYKDSNDDEMKRKYHSCMKNYKDVENNLEKVQKSLDSDDVEKILKKIDNAGEKLDKCGKEFEEGSFDRGHVGDRNDELKVYLDLVRVAAGDLEGYNYENSD